MNKNLFFRSVTATVCAVLCLALIFCITSCFNLSSNQRGTFSFTISEDIAQQLENALGPRSARSAGAPVITATVTLTKTAGGELTTPVAKSGTIASLINETFTFDNLPLHVPFTVSVSFKANGKEIFSGTSEPITLTSADATPVAIALYHMLDTDIVLPYWEYDAREDEYTPIGSFIFGENDTLEVPDPDDTSRLSGPVTSCFDAYGNIWSIDTMDSPVSYGVRKGLYFKGKEAYSFEDETDILTSGYVRSFIPYGYWITCDYATNELYICYWDSEAETYPVIKFSVDALLSLDPAKEMMLPSCMKEETELITDLKEIGYELSYVEPLITENDTVYDIIYDSIVFAVNNGILYSIGEDWDYYLASIDLKTKTILQKKPFDFSSIFGFPVNSWSAYICDMLYQDGKLYVLINHGNSLGALVRMDPATLSFNSSDVLGISQDIRRNPLEPEEPSTGVWRINADGYNDLYCEMNKKDDNLFLFKTISCNIISNDSNNFLGPIKFVAIKPKKLVVADCGFYYNDGDIDYYGNRLLTIDLTSFSITDETDVPFFMTDRPDAENLPVFESLPFTEGQELYYSTATDVWSTVKFSESLICTDFESLSDVPAGSIFYY